MVGTMPGNKTDDNGFPTLYDQFLYLLFELERAVEREGIDWSAVNTPLIEARLLKIAEKVARASSRNSGGRLH